MGVGFDALFPVQPAIRGADRVEVRHMVVVFDVDRKDMLGCGPNRLDSDGLLVSSEHFDS